MDSDKRTSMKQKYSDAGIKVIVSAFGSTEKPTTTKEDPTSIASQMAAWVKKYNVDGIDVDWEVRHYLITSFLSLDLTMWKS